VTDDLKLAIATCERFGETEMVVSQKVFMEVVDQITLQGNGQVRMNTRQENNEYPYLHKAVWEGITFMHFSRDALRIPPSERN
jgi:hypothetical protein